MEQTDYQKKFEQLEGRFKEKVLQFENLVKKINEVRSLQKAYFKSNKDTQILLKSKQAERELDELLNPKPVTQAQMDFLGR